MSAHEKLKELISKLDDADLKASLTSQLSELNKEKGEALSDLSTQKKIVAGQKEDLKTMEQIAKVFEQNGVKVDNNSQILEIANQLGSKVDSETSLKEIGELVTAQKQQLLDMQKSMDSIAVKDKMLPLLEKARKDFKDADGNLIPVFDDFIDTTLLVTDIDTTQEHLVNKKINDVLEIAKSKTEDFKKRNSVDFTGEKTHSIENQSSGINNRSQGIPNKSELKKDWDKSGKDTDGLYNLFMKNDLAHDNEN